MRRPGHSIATLWQIFPPPTDPLPQPRAWAWARARRGPRRGGCCPGRRSAEGAETPKSPDQHPPPRGSVSDPPAEVAVPEANDVPDHRHHRRRRRERPAPVTGPHGPRLPGVSGGASTQNTPAIAPMIWTAGSDPKQQRSTPQGGCPLRNATPPTRSQLPLAVAPLPPSPMRPRAVVPAVEAHAGGHHATGAALPRRSRRPRMGQQRGARGVAPKQMECLKKKMITNN